MSAETSSSHEDAPTAPSENNAETKKVIAVVSEGLAQVRVDDKPVLISKRTDYLQWDEFFMATALLTAQRSKDPSTQVGAVIVSDENIIVGVGYNGMPRGCHDDEMPWVKTSQDVLWNKYLYVCHAELNAILNKNSASVKGCTIYSTLFPCNECAKAIIQSGIKTVVYLHAKDKLDQQASQRLFTLAKVEMRQFTPQRKSILLDFEAHSSTSS
ncbi:Deoxycytidylate deaminase [Aphelenchoides fujianensis]|nr:Deoxycytidylate deaminase [Aphelenchoides fujianensis]